MNMPKLETGINGLLAAFAADPQMQLSRPVALHIPASFDLSGDTKTGLRPFQAAAYHDSVNANSSAIDSAVFVDKTASMLLRPVLANVVENDDGELDFHSHDMTVETQPDGTQKVVYLEKPVGVITEYSFVWDEEAQVNRAIASGYLYEAYGQDAVDILERRGSVSCSIELMIEKAHVDMDRKVLVLDDYYCMGLTLLGADVEPGMKGSECHLVQETAEEEFSLWRKKADGTGFEKITLTKEMLQYALQQMEENTAEKKGVENMEDLENKVEPELEETETPEPEETTEPVSEEQAEDTVKFSSEEIRRIFGYDVSLSDRELGVMEALGRDEPDANLWSLKVYDGYCVYSYWDVSMGKYFRRKYDMQDTTVVLAAETEEVTPQWKSFAEAQADADLQTELENLRQEVARMQSELQTYHSAEEQARKEELLSDPAYEQFSATAAYADLKDGMADMSIEELESGLNKAFAAFAREKLKPAEQIEAGGKKFAFPSATKKAKGRYGNIFDRDKK